MESDIYAELEQEFGDPGMHCDDCEMVSINGVACHETGCPNSGSRWDGERWVKQRKCSECGQTVDADEACCDSPDIAE